MVSGTQWRCSYWLVLYAGYKSQCVRGSQGQVGRYRSEGQSVWGTGKTGHSVPGTQYGDHNGIMVDYIGYEKCRGKIFTLSVSVWVPEFPGLFPLLSWAGMWVLLESQILNFCLKRGFDVSLHYNCLLEPFSRLIVYFHNPWYYMASAVLLIPKSMGFTRYTRILWRWRASWLAIMLIM